MIYLSQVGNAELRLMVISGLIWLVGCVLPPASVPWREDQNTLGSESPAERGSLVVETEYTGTTSHGDDEHAPIYVYDPDGHYLNWFPNHSFLPNRLNVGRYVIVSRVSGKFKRVQVEIQKGSITYVRLKDLREAPTAEVSQTKQLLERP